MLILVWEQAPKSHGKQSGFMTGVETELREVEDVQKLRGGVGSKLREWMLNPDTIEKGLEIVSGDLRQEGKEVASEAFQRLNRLSSCVWEILSS